MPLSRPVTGLDDRGVRGPKARIPALLDRPVENSGENSGPPRGQIQTVALTDTYGPAGRGNGARTNRGSSAFPGACPYSENRYPPRIKCGASFFRDMR